MFILSGCPILTQLLKWLLYLLSMSSSYMACLLPLCLIEILCLLLRFGLKLQGVQLAMSSAYHPQSDRQIEVVNRAVWIDPVTRPIRRTDRTGPESGRPDCFGGSMAGIHHQKPIPAGRFWFSSSKTRKTQTD